MVRGLAFSAASLVSILFTMSCGGKSAAVAAGLDGGAAQNGGLTFPVQGTPLPCDVDRVFASQCRSSS